MSASFVCCQVEVYASGRSFVQRSPTECGVSECDREASIMRRPRSNEGCLTTERKKNSDGRDYYCNHSYLYLFVTILFQSPRLQL
jgi:hypothetical protein